MNDLYLICPGKMSDLQREIHAVSLKDKKYKTIDTLEKLDKINDGKIVFSVYIDKSGINIPLMEMLKKISADMDFFKGSSAVVLIHGDSELFTKSIGRRIIFYLNQSGASFIGRPMLEVTGSMKNLVHIAMAENLSLKEACLKSSTDLVNRLVQNKPVKSGNEQPELLVLHSSNWRTSNTLMLWKEVKSNLKGIHVNEIHIENGSVRDCIGCPFKTCSHYGQQERCYYGGIMVEDVYPAVLSCDALLLLCPNYNDSISANLSAVINRLTALFRKTQFYDKYLFSIIVSGHSGSDILAEQLISALNINKTFRLPPGFSMMETANDPGAVLEIENIRTRAKDFAEKINETLT
ncbi:Multimeric flavodoxin WrbA [Dethiosulfatibacter aminovorans DSM 17477]|uniref:Multimeric flavodoxin WrbA n=1 Tax=Dethiosulfatibacter aminovorans DSM 17477 TaxID=1121476 RepID=A0A1M6GRH5_9FIRM|nr:NAD(P)H-dependent oxidoreductase [Dethiosulfatibacter aminovorans]SHJ12510.1 Multimeric flavodoxin WrbA [Dethiosulfatibacter aminovorans DSM 17477]